MSEDVPYITLKRMVISLTDRYMFVQHVSNVYLTYNFSSRNVMTKEDCKKEKLV